MIKFKPGQYVFVWRKCRFGKINSVRQQGSVQTLWVQMGPSDVPFTRVELNKYFKMPREYPDYSILRYTAITPVVTMVNYIGILCLLLIAAQFFGG